MKKKISTTLWKKHILLSALALLISMPIAASPHQDSKSTKSTKLIKSKNNGAKTQETSCKRPGAYCSGSGECPDCCCEGTTCLSGVCQPENCLPRGTYCSSSGECPDCCCEGLTCHKGVCDTVTCQRSGEYCNGSGECPDCCCEGTTCVNGVCQ